LAVGFESGAQPVVLLTKADLSPDLDADMAAARSVAPAVDVVAVSLRTAVGLDDVAARLRPHLTGVLLGPSGSGKSSLVNRLLSEERLEIGALRNDGKGRHTTVHRELVILPGGGLVIDTPGLRSVGLWGSDAGLEAAFSDIEELAQACRFDDCSHGREPGCAVTGVVPADRVESWRRLQRELTDTQHGRRERS
jgi:ribosome biogenesis GTPase